MLLALAQKHGYTVAASTEIKEINTETMITKAPSLVLADLQAIKKAGTKKQDVCEGQLLLVF